MVKSMVVALFCALGLLELAACGDGHDHSTHEHGKPAVKSPEASAAGVDPNAKPYPLDTCIVSGGKLGSMGEPMKFAYKGQEIKLCCKGCEKKFYAEPEKHLDKIAAASPK